VELKALDARLHGWDVNPDDIQICTRADGSEWVLGAGTFGAVSCAPCPASLNGDPAVTAPTTTLDSVPTLDAGLLTLTPQRLLILASSTIHAQVYKALRDGVQDVAVKKLKVDATENGVQSFLEVRAQAVMVAPLTIPIYSYNVRRCFTCGLSPQPCNAVAQHKAPHTCGARGVKGGIVWYTQECSILKSLNYDKNIVQFFGAVLRPGVEPMLVLEFMEVRTCCFLFGDGLSLCVE